MSLFCPHHPCDIFGVLHAVSAISSPLGAQSVSVDARVRIKHLGVSTFKYMYLARSDLFCTGGIRSWQEQMLLSKDQYKYDTKYDAHMILINTNMIPNMMQI